MVAVGPVEDAVGTLAAHRAPRHAHRSAPCAVVVGHFEVTGLQPLLHPLVSVRKRVFGHGLAVAVLVPPGHVEDHPGVGRRGMHQTVERPGRGIDLAGHLSGRHRGSRALLLQDDVIPAAVGNGLQQLLVFQVPREAFAALEKARTGEFYLLGRGDLLHHAGQIVAIGETVADPQHPQGILRRLGHAAQRQQNQQKAESEFHHIFKVLGWR